MENVNPELDMIMMGTPTAFNPQVAGDLDATIQYTLTGDGGGKYYLCIKGSICTAHRGTTSNADFAINSPAEVWMAISRGELDGLQAYMDGKYQMSGDMNIMIIMDKLFNKTRHQEAPSASNQALDSKEDILMIDKSTLNCHDIVAGMTAVFDPEAAGDLTADIQFEVTGEDPGSYYLHIEKGTCTFNEDHSPSSAMTIHTPSEVWLAVSRGEMDGQAALMQGKYTVEGDFNLLLKFNEMFN